MPNKTPLMRQTPLVRAGLMLALGCFVAAPNLAAAQDRDLRNYDGYCYAKKKDAQTNGTVIGAVLGGLIGSQVSKNERGLGTAGGAVIGGVIGNNVGKNSVKCYNGEYYSYQGSYYDPAPAPSGYSVVYYKDRPANDRYDHVYYDRYHHTSPPPYNYGEAWRKDDNNPNGWRDNDGRWHESRGNNRGHNHGNNRGNYRY
ncbi:MAG: glycine zipper 2TM domain-containing protein [Asticcacaulis sp.]